MDARLPVVSVCLITYNQEKYIARTLTGLLAQEADFPFEIVVGDDASTDGTSAVCREFAARYPESVRFEEQTENVGFLRNFYITCSRCCGQYIAFCEGDDYWTDVQKLKKQVDFLHANPDYGLVCTNVASLDDLTGRISQRDTSLYEIGFDDLLCRGNTIATVSVCCRKEYVRSFFEAFADEYLKWRMADLPLWLYIACRSKIKYLPEVTCVYRILPESASHSRDRRKEWLFQKGIYEISLFFKERYGLASAEDEDCFYRRFYFWMIAAGNKEHVFRALSLWRKKRAYGWIGKGAVYLLFWRQEKLIFLLGRMKERLKRIGKG